VSTSLNYVLSIYDSLPIIVFPSGQGRPCTLPDFVQYKVVKGVVLHPVLGTVVLAERPIGLTGVNLLRVLGVGGTDGQRLAALAALDKPGKQAGFSVLTGALPGVQLDLPDGKTFAVNQTYIA